MGSTQSSGQSKASSEAGSATVPPTRATSETTATGMQIQHESGDQHIPSGKEAGSPIPVDEPDPKGKPKGLQAEPALFVSNGSISSTDVATPTGLQPIATVATSPEHGKELIKQRTADHKDYLRSRTTPPERQNLDEATIGRLHRGELQAIGRQRGYDMPDAGTRATRAAFVAAQSKDENIKGGSVAKGSKGGNRGAAGKGSQQASEGVSNRQLTKATKRTAPTKRGEKAANKAPRRGR